MEENEGTALLEIGGRIATWRGQSVDSSLIMGTVNLVIMVYHCMLTVITVSSGHGQLVLRFLLEHRCRCRGPVTFRDMVVVVSHNFLLLLVIRTTSRASNKGRAV